SITLQRSLRSTVFPYTTLFRSDPERQRVLAEYLGFVFIKHGSNALKEEKALILYGTGANGKSVFFEVVNALLGTDNVSSYSLQRDRKSTRLNSSHVKI